MNMKVDLCGVTLNNPVMTASGTFGAGEEYSEFVDLNRLFASANVRLWISIFIPVSVLINDKPSAPPASAARAISVMSVTFGESFMMTGCFACALISLVISSTIFGFCPKAIPPSFTFGQEI